MKVDNNEIKMETTIEKKSMKPRVSWFWEKIREINKPQAKLSKIKKRKDTKYQHQEWYKYQ